MTDFVRARSEEQKQARMAEIKVAADELFCSVPYQEITLSTIAGKPLQICNDEGRDLS